MTSVPNPRPRASLGRVLDDLGATLLDLVHGSADRVDEIGGVVIHDPVDAPVLPRDALVLGVGVDDPDQVVELLGELGRAGAVGLVLRAPVPADAGGPGRGRRGRGRAARAEPRRPVGTPGRDAALAARRGRRRRHRAGVAGRAAVRRPVRGRERDRLAARRPDHHRGPQLPGPRVLRPPGRGRPLPGRDDPRPPGARALLADPQRARRLPRAATAATSPCSSARTRRADAFSMPRVAIAVRAGDEVLGSIWAAVPEPAQRGARRGTARRRQAGRPAPAPGPRRRRRAAPGPHRPAQLRAGGRRRRSRGPGPARPRRTAAHGARRRRVGARRRRRRRPARTPPTSGSGSATRSRCT